jgi:streptogramin lyase
MTHATSSSKKLRARYRRAIKHLEALEPRTLLSVSPIAYNVPNVWAGNAVYDNSGSLWIYDIDEPVVPALVRLKGSAVDSAAGSVIPLDNTQYSPNSFASGPNGHIYATDLCDGIKYIDDIDPSIAAKDSTANPISRIPLDVMGMPSSITVTGDGAVWFTALNVNSDPSQHDNILGRMDPKTHEVAIFKLDASLSDSQIGALCVNGSDSVWMTLAAYDYPTETSIVQGTNRIATASFSNGQFTVTPYEMTTGTDADVNGNIGGIVSDRQGGVWFSLANLPYNTRPGSSPDAIVHGTFDAQGQFVETAYVAPGTDVNTPRMYTFLTSDNTGAVWFVATGTNQLGTFDGANFTFFDDPVAGTVLGQTCARADGSQITVLTAANMDLNTGEYLYQGDPPLIELDFATKPPEITFQGEAYNVNIKEDTALNGMLLATFVAPTPTSAYKATITWGDGSTTTVKPTLVGDNTYAIVVSGKSFAKQGSFAGSIAISDDASPIGKLSFTSTVGDTPLNVTSFNVTPLLLRIAAATATFTDDADLSTSTWTATIKWGDNTSSTGLIVRDPTQAGRYLVIGLHQYRTRGTYTARLTVTTSEIGASILNATLTTTVSVR